MRTKKLSGNRYMHVCFIGGKSYAGEVRTKEKKRPARILRPKQVTKKLPVAGGYMRHLQELRQFRSSKKRASVDKLKRAMHSG